MTIRVCAAGATGWTGSLVTRKILTSSEDIRRIIYTTNAIESVNMTLRKVTRNHRIFPSDEAVYKVVYLAMRNITKKWTMPIHNWKPALNRLAVELAERFPK